MSDIVRQNLTVFCAVVMQDLLHFLRELIGSLRLRRTLGEILDSGVSTSLSFE